MVNSYTIIKLKNRYGDSDVNLGLSFHGEVGLFRELPKPDEISDYEPYINLLTQDKKEEEDEEINNEYFKL